jgi:REP element-mobilizing transposase RayT
MVAEAVIRKTCVELYMEIIDLAVNPDHISGNVYDEVQTFST